jgi:hypothetical protein
MKVINNTRYCTADVQRILDWAIVAAGPDARAGYAFSHHGVYKHEDVTLILAEHNVGNREMYGWDEAKNDHGSVRMYLKRTSWTNPHKVFILNTDMVETNKLAMLTASVDAEGWLHAPKQVVTQLLEAFSDRLQGSGRATLREQTRRSMSEAPLRLRYRLGSKPKPTQESRELERVTRIAKARSEIKRKSRAALQELAKINQCFLSLSRLAADPEELGITAEEKEAFDRQVKLVRGTLAKMGR